MYNINNKNQGAINAAEKNAKNICRRHMKYAAILACLFSFFSMQLFAQCCLVDSLTINTGYNPVTGTAVTPIAPDPHWKVCAIDPDLTSDVIASGSTPVGAGNYADVINRSPDWAPFPGGAGGPGNWINSFNGYAYTQTKSFNYYWTACRTFTLQCDAWVTLNFPNITADNWITGGDVDGTPIPITLTAYSGPAVYAPPIYIFGGSPGTFYTTLAPFVMHLTAGTHTISFNLLNDNYRGNHIGFAAQGYIKTLSPSIVPENNPSCTAGTSCPVAGPSICVGETTTLTNAVGGGTWSSAGSSTTVDAATGVVTGIAPGMGTITYSLPAGMGCPVLTNVTVNPIPVITGSFTPCSGSSETLSASIAGGIWSSDNVSVASIDMASGVVACSTAGTANIFYTLPNGCSAADTMQVVNCHRPCADSARIDIIPGAAGNEGCTFTATATVSTSNIIIGYQWSAGGTTVIHHTNAGTDNYVFSVSPGTATVTCIVYIVDTAFDSSGPCCQVVLTQTVTCTSKPTGCCFDSASTYLSYYATSDKDGNCIFNVTANMNVLKGCKFLGYTWNTNMGYTSGLVPWNVFSLPPVPPGFTAVVTVTYYALSSSGDTCEVTRILNMNCRGGNPDKKEEGTPTERESAINIYPNPVTQDVTVTSATEDLKNIQIIDVNGKKVGNYSYDHARTINLSLERLPAGTYMLRVNNNVFKVITKIN